VRSNLRPNWQSKIPKRQDSYFFFRRFTFFAAAFFLLFAMLPSWYQVATSLKCSRESICTANRLLQTDEKNSDLVSFAAFATTARA